MDIDEIVRIIANFSTAVKNFNEILPAQRRKKVVVAIGEFGASPRGKNFMNWLIALESFGILIVGFLVSYVIVKSLNSTPNALYSGLGAFVAFASFALFIFNLRSRK
jgi:hypothetical protein